MASPRHRFDTSALTKLVGYFDPQVLAGYRNEPDKYKVETDFFEGQLTVHDSHYRVIQAAGREQEDFVDVRFGYRTRADGSLALVAWLPDLFEKSQGHLNRWAGFRIESPRWLGSEDVRFESWLRRNIEGDWNVESGPSTQIASTIRLINGLTAQVCGQPLYSQEPEHREILYPAGENTHMYQDAHKQLYGILVDGLSKDSIAALASMTGKSLKTSGSRTLTALRQLLPPLSESEEFTRAFDIVGENRRKSAHGHRDLAAPFLAFSTFKDDLDLCASALNLLRTCLEKEFGLDAQGARDRQDALRGLPRIGRPAQAHYLIAQAPTMVGKTIKAVRYGFREPIDGVHESELLIVEFTDGAILAIDTGSNAWNISTEAELVKPEDFHVSLDLHWVPDPKPRRESGGESHAPNNSPEHTRKSPR